MSLIPPTPGYQPTYPKSVQIIFIYIFGKPTEQYLQLYLFLFSDLPTLKKIRKPKNIITMALFFTNPDLSSSHPVLLDFMEYLGEYSPT